MYLSGVDTRRYSAARLRGWLAARVTVLLFSVVWLMISSFVLFVGFLAHFSTEHEDDLGDKVDVDSIKLLPVDSYLPFRLIP